MPADSQLLLTAELSHPIDIDRLAAYLAAHGFHLDRDAGIRQFAAGLANINYLVSIDGVATVLRRPPDGELPPGAHDMSREHRVLSRLSKVFRPAPDSRHLCEDRAVLGVPFQLIEYRPGLVIKGDDRSRVAGKPDAAARLGKNLVETMAALHRVDAEAAGLGDLGRPDGFIPRGIAGWRKRADRLEPQGEKRRLVDEIGGWLAERTVRQREPVLLHCDIKLDNLILDPDTLEVQALIDWDMGTRGDPLFDLATLLSYWTEPADPPAMHRMGQMPTAAPGFQTRDEIAALYSRISGLDLSDLPTIRVLCLFKLATVFQQLHHTFGRGPGAREPYRSFDELALGLYQFTHQEMIDAG